MRLFHLHKILAPVFLGLFLTAFIPGKMLPPVATLNTEKNPKGAMEEYIEKIEGIWLSEQENRELGEIDSLWIELRREWIYRDKVYVKVSEYCQAEIAEYLVFELIEDKLQYVAAKDGELVFPLLYLDFMELSYEIEEEEVILYFESCEAEMENHLNRRLVRIEETNFAPSTLL